MGSRIYRVYVRQIRNFAQSQRHRAVLRALQVRQDDQLANLVTVTHTLLRKRSLRFNLFRSTEINGSAAPGISSGQAMDKMEQLAKENLPPGMGYGVVRNCFRTAGIEQ